MKIWILPDSGASGRESVGWTYYGERGMKVGRLISAIVGKCQCNPTYDARISAVIIWHTNLSQ